MNKVAIKDGRPGFYMIHNAVLDEHGAEMGPFGIALYNALCRFADRDHTAYPSLKRLATITGMSRRAVVTHLQRLVEMRLVGVEQRKTNAGDADTNLYTILPVRGVVQEMHHLVREMHQGSAPSAPGVVQEMHTNNTQLKNTQLPRQGVVGDGGLSDLATVERCWKENSDQKFTPGVKRELDKFVTAYGADEVLEAIFIAIRMSKISLAYVGGVLERRAAETTNGNGHASTRLVPLEDENE